MPVVTVSGQAGSGAREVGQFAARLLGIDYVDQHLLVEAARRCGVPVGAMAERDERCASFRERLAAFLRGFLERSAAAGGEPLAGTGGLEVLLSRTYAEMAAEREEPELSENLYFQTMSAIIQELGGRGNIVIVGRGSQMILHDRPDVLHVLCIAPLEVRVQRFAQREGLEREEAARRVAENDRGRAAYHRRFWKVDPDDPSLYDLTLQTAALPLETAGELVAAAARAKTAAASAGRG